VADDIKTPAEAGETTLAEQVARVRALAAEMKDRAETLLGRDPVENGICAGERYEAEVELDLAQRVLTALDGPAVAASVPGKAGAR
jgi:vacuolar-type H+-ATPase catalytic subunit A/Vma1